MQNENFFKVEYIIVQKNKVLKVNLIKYENYKTLFMNRRLKIAKMSILTKRSTDCNIIQ